MENDYIEINLPEGTNLTRAPMTDLQRRRLLCEDLEYCVTQDKELLSVLIDDYVYRLNDMEVHEYQKEVDRILGED